VTNPVDGKSIHLLGGPFSTSLNVPLGPFGTVLFRIIIEATLQPIIHQSQSLLNVKLSGGSTSVAGRLFNSIGGQATVTVPLGFALPPTLAGGGDDQHVPNVAFS